MRPLMHRSAEMPLNRATAVNRGAAKLIHTNAGPHSGQGALTAALTLRLRDGRACLDNDSAERAIRLVALGRKTA